MPTQPTTTRPRLAGPLGALSLGAGVAVLAGLVATGAAAATLLADAGPVTRWGQPLVRSISDISGALTIGLLVMAACVLPGSPSGRLRGAAERATRWAAASGAVWVVSGALGIVLAYSRLAGTSPFSPGFAHQLGYFVTDLPVMQALLVAVLMSAVAATGAAVATRHTTVGLMAVVAVLAMAPIALTGHAAGTVDHEAAVDGLGFHLVGIAVWLGGLGALAMLRPLLRTSLPRVTARYSTLALWAFVAVAGSGAVSAMLRVGSPRGLGTAYGALVIGKIVAVVLLGAAGYVHRRALLPRLRAGTPGPFWRLVIGELVVMGAAVGLGVALSESAPPVPQDPVADPSPALALTGFPLPAAPSTWSWIVDWRADLLWLPVGLVLAGAYLHGVYRLHRRGDHWSLLRTVPWLAGCLVLIWATSGAPGIYGRVLFSSHMLGHMAMSMVVPPLLVLGAPVTLVMRVAPRRPDHSRGVREWLLLAVHSRVARAVMNPIVAAGLFAISLIVFYYSPLFELSLRTHTGHVLMHLHFLLAGYVFASVLIGIDPGPKPLAYPMRMVLLFATMAFHAFFGVALMQGNLLLGGNVLDALGRTWGRSPLADQQFGGAIAWGVGEIPTLLLGLGIALAWVRADERDSRRLDRQAERDDDAALKAYNARLARIAEHDGERSRS